MNNLSSKLNGLADPARLRNLDFLLEPIQHCCSFEDGVCGCDLEPASFKAAQETLWKYAAAPASEAV